MDIMNNMNNPMKIKYKICVTLIGKHDNDTYDAFILSTPSFAIKTEEITAILELNMYDIKRWVDYYIRKINRKYGKRYNIKFTRNDFDIYMSEGVIWTDGSGTNG